MGTEFITPEILHDSTRFALTWELDHRNIAKALQPFIWRRSWVSATYIAANVVALGISAIAWLHSGIPLVDAFPRLCLGMLLAWLILLPVHEVVHALTYRVLGAKSIVVRYHWRTLTAYCAADRFVINRRSYIWVCLMPFLVLNPPLAVAAWLAPGRWELLFAGALLLHVGACSGDFGLANWLWRVGSADTLSYDDVAGERSYFFRPLK